MKKRKIIRVRQQLYRVYFLTLLPLVLIGLLLIHSTRTQLEDYYIQLLRTDNSRVKALLSEITMKSYDVSNNICFDADLRKLLQASYDKNADFISAANQYTALNDLTFNSLEIASVYIYTNNPTVPVYQQFRQVTDDVRQSDWYQKTLRTANAFWASTPSTGGIENYGNLCLVRRIHLDSNHHAVAVVQLSDNYIRSRMDSGSILDVVSLDDQGIVYSSRGSLYGQQPLTPIDYADAYYRSSGTVEAEQKQYFYTVSTINLYMSTSRLYVATLDNAGLADIQRVTLTWCLILLLAVLVPLVLLLLYANHFSDRVALLRQQMHKATLQDYDIIDDFSGNDELTEVFSDLKLMVRDIKEKDARMYEAELNEKELRNNQQLMEYKMLTSQINPHYLYNTLETIRMKALTSGSREVADSIKILGRTLHYVLENTGVAYTSLKKELEHVENYLSIQRLRFGDRIRYRMEISPQLQPEQCTVLPLLLQPVVENAVVHGLELTTEPGMITISALLQEDVLLLQVSDNGIGMDEQQLYRLRQSLDAPEMPARSIALYNIHQRIMLRYGRQYGLQVDSTVGRGTCVSLRLPAE